MKNRKYIENVLDKKFFLVVRIISIMLNINLEYGYHAMGLIESIKRRGKDESRKSYTTCNRKQRIIVAVFYGAVSCHCKRRKNIRNALAHNSLYWWALMSCCWLIAWKLLGFLSLMWSIKSFFPISWHEIKNEDPHCSNSRTRLKSHDIKTGQDKTQVCRFCLLHS